MAVTFAAVVLFFSSIPIFTDIANEEWMSLLGAISFAIGAIIVAVNAAMGTLEDTVL